MYSLDVKLWTHSIVIFERMANWKMLGENYNFDRKQLAKNMKMGSSKLVSTISECCTILVKHLWAYSFDV